MSEIEHQELSQIGQWALDVQQVHQVAVSLSKTAFVPESMQSKPGDVTAAILMGQEIGLDPMTSLRSIDVINGVPALRANTLRGLVQSAGHQLWVKESTKTRATVCGQRKGSERVEQSTFDMDRAKDMELTGKKNWQRMPQQMLVARATAEVARLIAADVFLGVPYVAEELDDPAEEAPKPKRRTAKRQPIPDTPTPELDAPQKTEGTPQASEDAPTEEVSDESSDGSAGV